MPVFPVVAYGITPYFRAYPGTVSLRVETYLRLVARHPGQPARSGFRRILIVNGHGGNQPAAVAGARMDDRPSGLPRASSTTGGTRRETWAKVQEIDPVASHASWMENFPWTRLAGVDQPTQQQADDRSRRGCGCWTPRRCARYLGDGNFGGYYQRPDEEMLALWDVAVEETRALLEGPWA